MISRTAISTQRLARDFGTLLGDFTAQVDVLLTQPAPQTAVTVPEIRREVCVAVWAAITASLEASAMSPEEKGRVTPLLHEFLIPFWQQHCAADPGITGLLAARAANYLEGRDPRSQVATATHIVARLLEEIGADGEEKQQLSRKLIPMFAHRMLGDTYHINDLRTRFGFQLPMFAALCLGLGFADVVEPTMCMLRLS